MKSITYSATIFAVGFAVIAIVILVYWYGYFPYRPIFKVLPPGELEFVKTTTDIEHLRKFTQLLIQEGGSVGKQANEVFDSAINLIAGLALFCSLLSLWGLAQAYRAYDLALGRPLRWWTKWLS